MSDSDWMEGWIVDHWIELFGAVTGIMFVLLEIRQNILLWPVGLLTSAVYIIVFFNSKFYADMGLQFYYLIVSVYGWYWWLRGSVVSSAGRLPVIRTPRKLFSILILIFVMLYIAIWFVLFRFTDSPVPGWDSFTTSIAIVATWMLARKYLEHWVLWMVANSVSIGLYIYKELYPTVILFIVYTVMAVAGYIKWKREMDYLSVNAANKNR